MLVLVAQFILCSTVSFQSVTARFQETSELILDITEQINGFKEGKTSREDFLAMISPGNCSNSTDSFFYKFSWDDTQSVKAIVKRMWHVSQILNNSLVSTSTIKLITFWSEIATSEEFNSGSIHTTVSHEIFYFPNIQLTIVVNRPWLGEKEKWTRLFKLSYLRQTYGISNNQYLRFGLEEKHSIANNNYAFTSSEFNLNRTDVTITVYNAEIEYLGDLDAGFNYFQKEVKPKSIYPGHEIVFRLELRGADFDIHRKYTHVSDVRVILPISYDGEPFQILRPQWIMNTGSVYPEQEIVSRPGPVLNRQFDIHPKFVNVSGVNMVFPVPRFTENQIIKPQTEVNTGNTYTKLGIIHRPTLYIHPKFDVNQKYLGASSASENQIIRRQKFSVIPNLNTAVLNSFDDYSLTTLLSIVLEAPSKGFSTLLIRHSKWHQLEYSGVRELFMRYTPAAATPLRVYIDYSEDEKTWFNTSHFPNHLKNESSISNHHNVVEVEALVIKIQGNVSLDNELNVTCLQNHFENFPKEIKIVCSLEEDSFENSNVTKIVTACKSIAGSQYILKVVINLLERDINKVDIFDSGDSSRKLTSAGTLRKQILKRHPNATIYVQVSIGVSIIQVFNPQTQDVQNQTLFCHEELQRLKNLIIGIITWANAYNFPMILNPTWTEGTSVQEDGGKWRSFLRMVPHINPEIQQTNESCVAELSYGFPLSYNKKYRTDPCIDWIAKKPRITADYFNSQNIGAIFHADYINHTESALVDAFYIMLQFVIHKFRLIEVVSGSKFSDLFTAISSIHESNSASTINSTVFISYATTENEVEETYAEFLRELESKAMEIVKAVHINLPEYSETGSILSKEDRVKLKLKLKKYIKLQSIFKNKIGVDKVMTKFGIVVSTEKLFELIQFHAKAEFDRETLTLLKKIDYVVFIQTIDLNNNDLDNKSTLQRMFNQHLDYKRIFENLLPHLKVYFHIEVNAEFTPSTENLVGYLVMLSKFKSFGRANNLGYFIVESFDNGMLKKNGWWVLKGESDPANPKSYIEKETVTSGYPMWYPEPISRPKSSFTAFHNSPLMIISLAVVFLLLVIVLLLGLVVHVRYRKLRQRLTDEEKNEFLNGKPPRQNGGDASNNECSAESMKFDPAFDLPMSDFTYDCSSILGMGTFGTVFKGRVKEQPAAIKQPNKNCAKGTFKSVLTEIKVLCYIGNHPNVVKFIGAYTKEIQQGILLLATELCQNGSLEKLLRTKRSVISEEEGKTYQDSELEKFLYFTDIHRFATEIASGMEYIESKKIVHGDLAARNILLDEHLTCKIGDFGLSRKLYEYQKYVKKSQEPLPWKWMAVESLAKMEFTSKSDVWSFGVTVWEIYTLGDTPYAGLNWTAGFVDELRNGLSLSIPQFAAENIFEIMMDCWNLDAEQRPTFSTLVNLFKQLNDTQYTVLGEQLA